MSQPSDLMKIRGLVARARLRIRTQGALEGATTAFVVAAAAATAIVFLVRTESIDQSLGIGLLAACGGLVAAGALIGALRKVDDERVARRIDRASNLSDRLSTAVAFDRALAIRGPDAAAHDEDGVELMQLAIRDAAAKAERANVAAATPFALPRDAKAALVFLVIGLLAAGIRIPLPDRTPTLLRAEPDFGAPGAKVVLVGKNFMTGVSRRPAAAALPTDPTAVVGAAPGAPAAAPEATIDWIPSNVSVYLGAEVSGKRVIEGIPVDITAWSARRIGITIPGDAPLGDTTLTVFIGQKPTKSIPFKVVDPKDTRYHREDTVAPDEDELDYARQLLDELKQTAQRDQVKELEDYAAKIEKLLEQAERGELTKEQLLDELQKADEELQKNSEPRQDEIDKDLKETGEELQKNEMTKDLGKALENGQLDEAKKELEKLAEKLEKGELSDKQKEQLAKAMEKAAEKFEKKEEQRQQEQKQQMDKLQEEIRKLEKQRDQAKTEQQRQEFERRLEKKQRDLKKLEKDQEQREESEQRRALKRLHKDMEKSAEDLQKKKDPSQDQEQQEQEQEQQASRSLKDAANETGRVDQDQRKQAAQKKVASQMEDLREAMRRAKRRGSQGAQDPFGKNGKNQDFIRRARGQKGSGQAWKPGQGKGKGQGQQGNQPGGQGQQPGGQNWGTGHDPNLTGDPTGKSGDIAEQDLQGTQGKGSSRRETILSAAQKGFSGQGYKKVYADYKRIVEEVMRNEKVPSSYKYYVKRYFTKIKPHSMD